MRKLAAVRGLVNSELRGRLWVALSGADPGAVSEEAYLRAASGRHRDSSVVEVDVARSLWGLMPRGAPDGERAERREALARLLNAVVTHHGGDVHYYQVRLRPRPQAPGALRPPRRALQGCQAGERAAGGGQRAVLTAQRASRRPAFCTRAPTAAGPPATHPPTHPTNRRACMTSRPCYCWWRASAPRLRSCAACRRARCATRRGRRSTRCWSCWASWGPCWRWVVGVMGGGDGGMEMGGWRWEQRGCVVGPLVRTVAHCMQQRACGAPNRDSLPLNPQAADPELASLARDLDLPPYYALSWFITWFSHDVGGLDAAARLFDLFLSVHPLMPLYVGAAAMRSQRAALLAAGRGEGGMPALHSALTNLDVTKKLGADALACEVRAPAAALWVFLGRGAWGVASGVRAALARQRHPAQQQRLPVSGRARCRSAGRQAAMRLFPGIHTRAARGCAPTAPSAPHRALHPCAARLWRCTRCCAPSRSWRAAAYACRWPSRRARTATGGRARTCVFGGVCEWLVQG